MSLVSPRCVQISELVLVHQVRTMAVPGTVASADKAEAVAPMMGALVTILAIACHQT